MVESGLSVRTATVVVVVSTAIAVGGTGLFGGMGSLGTGASMIVLTVFAAPITYAGYKISLLISVPTTTRVNDTRNMDAEVVKKRTERWSEEAAINPAFPPGQDPPASARSQSHSSSSEEGETSADPNEKEPRLSPESQGLDTSEMEFHWQTETDVSFDDIAGMDELKDELRAEVIKPLANREKAEELGVSAPNIVFHGPPGTGKTYTATALATELGLPFAKLSGADVQSKWINESASKVNSLFTEARRVAAKEGGAVVSIDELDSVLKARSGEGSSHEEDNKVVNEFLAHLQETKDHNIVFIGATNRLEALDEAGTRSGRIDKKIHVGKPDAEAREAILRAQLNGRNHEISDTGIANLAGATSGAVAADLELLVNRAAKQVLARDGDAIQWADIRAVVR